MRSGLFRLASLRSRSRTNRALAAPALVTLVLVATWAWLATAIFVIPVAILFALGLGAALLATWLTFAEDLSSDARTTNDNLLTQLGLEGRGNRRMAIYDSTSGLYNRWYLELRLQEEFLRCKRYNVSMAVIVIRLGSLDLADLSTDSWAGVAAKLAHTMAQSVRAVDITAALAPLEFAICLVHCDREGATRAVERMLSDLHGHPAEVGLAVYPEDQCDGKALIELARGRLAPARVEPAA
ncbi:MAG TPA: diguanylate cyclase [Dehalococcoidia bacterium]